MTNLIPVLECAGSRTTTRCREDKCTKLDLGIGELIEVLDETIL